jgi:ribosomal protein L31E
MSILTIEFRDFGTSFNSRTSRTWVYMANHVEEKMVKDNVATPPEVHQCGGDLNPLSNISNSCNETIWKKDLRGPLRTSGTARGLLIARGG